jgi:hypothetical protein
MFAHYTCTFILVRRHKLKNKVVPVQVMKAYGGIPPLVLNFGTRVVNLTPHSLFTLGGGKGTRYSLNGGMFGAQFFRQRETEELVLRILLFI